MALIDVGDPVAVPVSPEPPPQEMPYARILRRQKWFVVGGVVAGLAISIAVAARTKPLYRAETLLSVEREQTNPLDLGASSRGDAGADARLDTEVRLLTNRQVAERVATAMLPTPGAAAGGDAKPSAEITRDALALQSALDVRVVRNTNLIVLSATASTPEKAAEIANAIAQAYIDWKLEARYRLVAQAAQFLNSQIEQAKADLEVKEQGLLAYARQRDIISADPQANSAIQRVEALNRDAAAALADRLSKESRYEGLRTSRPEVMAEVLSSASITASRADIARLEREYNEKLALFKPEWPAMVQLKAQIEGAKQHLERVIRETVDSAREQAQNDLQLARRREETINETLKTQRQEALKLGGQSVEYSRLRVVAETQRALVDNLLKRQAELQVMARLQGERVSNIRIVESALTPTARFRPSYRRNALYGLLGGLLAGAALAVLRDSMDRTLRTSDELLSLLRIPALSSIPVSDRVAESATPEAFQRTGGIQPTPSRVGVELVAQLAPSSALAESYRALRTAVLLSQADGLRSIVVTSAVPLEGKTTTAVNLAIVMSQLGMKVLVVDGDLHRSRLHEVLHVSNGTGVVSALVGAIDVPLAFSQTAIPGLWVAPAGPEAPNPSNLLASQAMRRFLDAARTSFDFIVVDSPPLLALSDAIVLGSMTDGAILCVKAGSTNRELAARAVESLRRNGVRVLGAVLNQVPKKEQGDLEEYRRAYTSPRSEPAGEPPSRSAGQGA